MQEQHSAAFGLEVHSKHPGELVAFYERLLGVKFSSTTYPFPRYLATVGEFALIVTGSDEETAHSSFTLMTLSSSPLSGGGKQYLLYPKRPLGGRFPARYAERIADPDGNYVAMTPPLSYSRVKTASVGSWGELATCATELVKSMVEQARVSIQRRLDDSLDNFDYASGRIRIVNRELTGCSHLVASRRGLFAVNTNSYRQLLRGRFFGLTMKDGAIYCFQSCGDDNVGRPLRQDTHMPKGRVLKLSLVNGRIAEADIFLDGLDDNCHEIDFIGDDLFVVDCHNARMLKFDSRSKACSSYHPLGQMTRADAAMTYHMNSVAGHPDGSVWLLLHNYNRRPSEIVVVNPEFEIIRRFEVSAGSAHNIVFTNDELEYLVADSYGGRILSAAGPVIDGLTLIPRGLSLDDDTCVFGESLFETRLFRRYIPGRIHFAERHSWRVSATLELPAAPTAIRKIDGRDYSLANYVRADLLKKREAAASVSL